MTAPWLSNLLPWCRAPATGTLPRAGAAAACRLRSYSTNGAPDSIDAIRANMLSRPVQLTWDVIRPTNSHLLNVVLADFLPLRCQPAHFCLPYDDLAVANWFSGRGPRLSYRLPPAHHLVYFPLQRPASGLCPDGTDPLHSPGGPWVRRMWAGGSIAGLDGDALALDTGPAVCVERVDGVAARGQKIFVEVLREYLDEGTFASRWDSREGKLRGEGEGEGEDRHTGPKLKRPITERRTLVFMRERSAEEQQQQQQPPQGERSGRIVRAPHAPDFSVTLTPTPTLLFHYSALTFNAHAIHLDRGYCRDAEGYRDLLVHGPLSLTLMLAVLGARLEGDKGERIASIDYRHLAPLYVGEPMRICVRRAGKKEEDGEAKAGATRKWDVWVEDKNGGLSVKGSAVTKT